MHMTCDELTYGTLNVALLSCKQLAKNFRSWGLEMNTYEPCARNKIFKNLQLIVLFHMDDVMMAHG